jgi:hypothetical protein
MGSTPDGPQAQFASSPIDELSITHEMLHSGMFDGIYASAGL